MISEGITPLQPEAVKPETVIAIRDTIESKFNNDTVVRADPNWAIFVLNDQGKNGHLRNTEIEIQREDSWTLVRLNESFNEVAPRQKPSVLVTDFELDQGTMTLSLDESEKNYGSLAKARLHDLKSKGRRLLPKDKDELSYTPSETHAQEILTSLKDMKLFIR